MKVNEIKPPRTFRVGPTRSVELKDCAQIDLDPDEQVTFRTIKGGEYDVVRKSWGFYATPSLNGRLPSFGLHPALVKCTTSQKYYLFLMEEGQEKEFEKYLKSEDHVVVCWLDREDELRKIR